MNDEKGWPSRVEEVSKIREDVFLRDFIDPVPAVNSVHHTPPPLDVQGGHVYPMGVDLTLATEESRWPTHSALTQSARRL